MLLPSGVGNLMKATDKIRGLQQLTNMTRLKCTLCLCNVLQRFVPNFTRIVASLNCKQGNDQASSLELQNQILIQALETLDHWLLSPPILALPWLNRIIKLDTKTCYDQFGCGLLLVVWDVLLLIPYLKASQVTLQTDHDGLQGIQNMSDATGKPENVAYEYQGLTSKGFPRAVSNIRQEM